MHALLSDRAVVLGSQSKGQSKMVQEPRARFHVPEWRAFCHTAKLRNHPPCLKLVLSDSVDSRGRSGAVSGLVRR